MRYYSIVIDGKTVYTSHPNGPNAPPDPGALNVELDIPQGPGHITVGASIARIWGIGLDTIAQSNQLTGKSISIYGGMGVGFPLATAQAQNSGLLVQGSIYPAFGNWLGTDMTLDLCVSNIPAGNQSSPANLVHQAKQGQNQGDAVKQTLQKAYPGYTVDVSVSDKLVMPHDDTGFYQSIEQFADYINRSSISIFGGGAFMANVPYPGIQIAAKGNAITVRDGQKNTAGPKTITYNDLIGQPTWLDLNTVQVKTIMRGDIDIVDMVTLPPTVATTTAASNPQLRSNSVFQGTFMVQKIRHVGNFRQPDGMSWITNFDMVVANSPGSERGSGQTTGTSGTTPNGFVAGPN